jgi:maltose O-acetyltransferase
MPLTSPAYRSGRSVGRDGSAGSRYARDVPKGHATPWRSAGATVDRTMRRVLQRLRGEQNIDRLVAAGLELGSETFIARNVYLDPGHPWLIKIDDHAGLSPGVIVMAHDASMKRHMGHTRIGRVVIGKRVFVGAGAIILPGTWIGDDSIVGAGSVVRGGVPPGSMVVGNPAKVVADVKSVAEFHQHAAEQGPTWPHEGWTVGRGITAERKRAQRQALADGISGYLAATPPVDSNTNGRDRASRRSRI